MRPDDTDELPVTVFSSKEWAGPPDPTRRSGNGERNSRWGFVALALLSGITIGWLLASPSVTTAEPDVSTTNGNEILEAAAQLTQDEFNSLLAAQNPVVVPTSEITQLDMSFTLTPRDVAPGQDTSVWRLSEGQMTVEVDRGTALPPTSGGTAVVVSEDVASPSRLLITDPADGTFFEVEGPTAQSPEAFIGAISSSGKYLYLLYDVSTSSLPEPDLVVFEVESGKAIVQMAAADGEGTVQWIGNDLLAYIERVGAQQHLRVFNPETEQASTVATMTGAVAWVMAVG